MAAFAYFTLSPRFQLVEQHSIVVPRQFSYKLWEKSLVRPRLGKGKYGLQTTRRKSFHIEKFLLKVSCHKSALVQLTQPELINLLETKASLFLMPT